MSSLHASLRPFRKGKVLLIFMCLLLLIALFIFCSRPQISSAQDDTAPPTILNLSPEEDSYTPYHKPLISADILDNVGVDPSTILLKLDGQEVQASYDMLTGELTHVPQDFLPTGVHNIYLQASDLSGNKTTCSCPLLSKLSFPMFFTLMQISQ
jgi:hypothetical protein